MTADLRERILSGSGPDRELDALVWCALHPPRSTDDGEDLISFRPTRKDDQCAPGTYWRVSRSGMSLQTAPPLTASIDACLALMGEVLPGWKWARNYLGSVFLMPPYSVDTYRADHEDLPRALLAALLDAKAQEARND